MKKKRLTRAQVLKAGLCADCRKRKRWTNPANGNQITRCFTCKERVYGSKSARFALKKAA